MAYDGEGTTVTLRRRRCPRHPPRSSLVSLAPSRLRPRRRETRAAKESERGDRSGRLRRRRQGLILRPRPGFHPVYRVFLEKHERCVRSHSRRDHLILVGWPDSSKLNLETVFPTGFR